MGWYVRCNERGLHMVYSQQAQASCGIACVIMTNFKMKKWDLARSLSTSPAGLVAAPAIKMSLDSAVKVEEEVYAAYARISGKPYNGSTYTHVAQLAPLLNQLGIGTWQADCMAGATMAERFKQLVGPGKAPIIALVHWSDAGGHFVVCDTIAKSGRETVADICDPWDGALRTVTLTSGQPINYVAQSEPNQVDMGQKHFQYGSRSHGEADGWIIRMQP